MFNERAMEDDEQYLKRAGEEMAADQGLKRLSRQCPAKCHDPKAKLSEAEKHACRQGCH